MVATTPAGIDGANALVDRMSQIREYDRATAGSPCALWAGCVPAARPECHGNGG